MHPDGDLPRPVTNRSSPDNITGFSTGARHDLQGCM
jgi:hypothetical protein